MITTNDVSILLGIIRTAYPRFYAEMPKTEIKATVELWTLYLSDTDLETAKLAIQSLIATCKFPPTIAEVREAVAGVKYEPMIDTGAAWLEIKKAISRYGHYREQEALESMSKDVRKAAEYFGFRQLCLSENEMADRAHFIKIYETVIRRGERERLIPGPINDRIRQLAAHMSIGSIGQNDEEEPL